MRLLLLMAIAARTTCIISGQAPTACTTDECQKQTAMLIANVDKSVLPCDDFFGYACGNFLKRKQIPADKMGTTQLGELSDKLNKDLKTLVEAEDCFTDSPSSKMVKKLYKSCMDTDKIQSQGLEPLKDILRQMGGWPAVEGPTWSNNCLFNWVNNTYINKELGYPINLLFNFGVDTDTKKASQRIITIDQFKPGMPSRNYLVKGLNDSNVQAYLDFQVSLAELLGADRAYAKQQLTESLEFEIQMASFALPREQRRNFTKLYNKMSIAQIQKLVPTIPWLNYINTILHPYVTVTESEEVVVKVPSYIVNLGKLLEVTPKRVVANYKLWRISATSIKHLSEDARQLQMKYDKKIQGIKKQEPRSNECIKIVSRSLKHAVSRLYANKFFKIEAKVAADQMVTYILDEFTKILRRVDWMDDKTRVQAIKKSLAITPRIAYPKEILNDAKLEEIYRGLHITDGQLLSNMQNITIFRTNNLHRRLREKVIKNDWKDVKGAAVINAFYEFVDNSIVFPAGILQGLLFGSDRPMYLNYGAIGTIIGHEITHGFDNEGSQFDYRGELKEWWDPETRSNFVEKKKCIINQYGNYTEPKTKIALNSVYTQAEDIADNGAIKEAYNAYQQWARDHGGEKPLPGLALSPNQLFWMSSANVFCGKYTPKAQKFIISVDTHSPFRFRVNGALKNSKEFSKDWNCPLGSKMNPVHKCTVW